MKYSFLDELVLTAITNAVKNGEVPFLQNFFCNCQDLS